MNIRTETASPAELLWPELVPARLIKRYKRFLVDARLENGKKITAHCPNSGSMLECCEPQRPIYLSHHNNPKRKLKYTWELIEMPASLVGVNTLVPNQLVFRAIKSGAIETLAGYDDIIREVSIGNGTRLDFVLRRGEADRCYVEVKNCTLVKNKMASFPDAVTTRGAKHLRELQSLKAAGFRTVMFFLIQRMDAVHFSPADGIDPDYGRELRAASRNGVEIIVYDVRIDLRRIALNKPVPFTL